MPIPRGRLEPEVMVGFEVPRPRSKEANDQERRADDDVETVKPGRHEERRRIDPVGEVKRGMAVLVSLNRRKAEAEKDRQCQSAQQAATVAFD